AGCSYIAAYTKACGRVDVDGSRHLLGDHAGLIHLLVIPRTRKKVTTRMQVIARPELDGLRLAIPSATRNFAVDRFVPYSIIVEHWNLKQHNPIEMITVPLIILMDVY
ncbi:unnamed protein product, partial [Brassica oleracea var. botrytis]